MTVEELRRVLADLPADLKVAVTTHEFFPFSRELAYVRACATKPPHDEGRFVLFGGAPRAILHEREPRQGERGQQ
jgi:hypothetical protein